MADNRDEVIAALQAELAAAKQQIAKLANVKSRQIGQAESSRTKGKAVDMNSRYVEEYVDQREEKMESEKREMTTLKTELAAMQQKMANLMKALTKQLEHDETRWRMKVARQENQIKIVKEAAVKAFEELLETRIELESKRGSRYKTKAKDPVTNVHQNRKFSDLGKPISEIFDELKALGLLRPLPPKAFLGPSPPSVNRNFYCHFHQRIGHETDKCTRLRHEIQDLIDLGKIEDFEATQPMRR